LDPIVRVEARRLRAKLKHYYDSTGRADRVVIEFPRGAYAPQFRLRGEEAPAAAAAPMAVAVLPFANLSPESGEDYFSDGLTEELILLLTRVEGLRVVAWESASRFRGREREIEAVRGELKVAAALRGSVRRAAGSVRVTAQLIDTATGAYLWSEAFNRDTHDVVAIQEEIARAIVNTLRLKLAPARAAPVAPKALNVECYNLCLQGRFHANRRTNEGLRKATACYEAAVKKDPQSAAAHGGLADSYILLADYGMERPHDAVPLAEAAAQRALDLDAMSSSAFAALGFIRSFYDWNWTEAETLYRRSIEVNPGYARAHHWFGVDFLAVLGRFEEADAEIQLARTLDPLSLILHEGAAFLRVLNRDYEGALHTLQQLAEMEPGFDKAYNGMGRALSLMGKYEEAIAMFEKANRMAGGVPYNISGLAQNLALAGRREEALGRLAELQEMSRARHVPGVCFAIVHMGLGEIDKSLDFLEASIEEREFPLVRLSVHPIYDEIRQQPRFQAILRRMNLLP